ncbi:MAG: amidohydrolase family protein, partial [Desulfurococcaceae archaeon]
MNNMGSWIIIREARLFDGREKVIENAVIVIDPSGYIRDVGSEGSVEYPRVENIIEINARGLTALPGLIDAHMHLTGFRTGDVIKEPLLTPYETLVARCVVDLESLINAGFTTVVDAGSVIALGLKQAVEEGSIKGPRIIAAGLPISQTFGHGDTHYLPIEYVDYRTTKL